MNATEVLWFDAKEVPPPEDLEIFVLIHGLKFSGFRTGVIWWIKGNPPNFEIDKWRYLDEEN